MPRMQDRTKAARQCQAAAGGQPEQPSSNKAAARAVPPWAVSRATSSGEPRNRVSAFYPVPPHQPLARHVPQTFPWRWLHKSFGVPRSPWSCSGRPRSFGPNSLGLGPPALIRVPLRPLPNRLVSAGHRCQAASTRDDARRRKSAHAYRGETSTQDLLERYAARRVGAMPVEICPGKNPTLTGGSTDISASPRSISRGDALPNLRRRNDCFLRAKRRWFDRYARHGSRPRHWQIRRGTGKTKVTSGGGERFARGGPQASPSLRPRTIRHDGF